jgi:hypothetical protein
MKNKNKLLTELLTTAIEQVIEGLEKCEKCGGSGNILDDKFACGCTISSNNFQSACGIHTLCSDRKRIPCPHCADNRARAAELRKVVEGLWHEWSKPEKKKYGYKFTCSCGYWFESDDEAINIHSDHLIEENPDFTTYDGLGRLVEILKMAGLYDEFIRWLIKRHWNMYSYYSFNRIDWEECLVEYIALLFTSPELFMDAAIAFLQEREK